MDAKKQFLSLKEEWIKTKEDEREDVEKRIDAFFCSLSEAQKKEVQEAVREDFAFMRSEVNEIKQLIDVREKLSSVLPIVSVSYIAKHFFNKSSSWFYQRLNGNLVHGKPAKFTQEELSTLSNALLDMGKQLQNTACLIA